MLGDGDVRRVTAGQVKSGDALLIDGRPVKITSAEHSQPGKHGATKVRFTGRDVFRPDKRMHTLSACHSVVDQPILVRAEVLLDSLFQLPGQSSPIHRFNGRITGGTEVTGKLTCVATEVLETIQHKHAAAPGCVLLSVIRFGSDEMVAGCRVLARGASALRHFQTLDRNAAGGVGNGQGTGALAESKVLSRKAQRALKKAERKAAKANTASG